MSIEGWLDRNFNKTTATSDGEDIKVDCPFCDDKKQHLYVSLVKQAAHCFKCEWAGSHYELVKEVSGAASALEVWQELRRPRQTAADFISIADRLDEKRKLPVVESYQLPDWYVPFSDINLDDSYPGIILNYALKRLSYADIIRYGIGYCSDPTNPLAFRLIVPVEDGYYQARAINKHSKQKYLNPVVEIAGRLFNYRALELYNDVIICEGAFSAIAAGKNAIATLGKRATPAQLRRLAASDVSTFTIAYDAGEERSKKATELADRLVKSGKNVIIRAYEFGDPDECDQFQELRYSASFGVESQLMGIFAKQRPFNFAYV